MRNLGSGDGGEESALNIWVVLEYFGQHLHVIELPSCPEKQLRLRHKIEVNCFCVIIVSIWTGRRVPSHSAVFMEDEGFVTDITGTGYEGLPINQDFWLQGLSNIAVLQAGIYHLPRLGSYLPLLKSF